MKDDWRILECFCFGGERWEETLAGPQAYRCRYCGGTGLLWVRPSGHAFLYPGGPAWGSVGRSGYEEAVPVPEPQEIEGEVERG